MEVLSFYQTPLGTIKIGCSCGSVNRIQFVAASGEPSCPTALSDLAAAQITEYFALKRRDFDFPMQPAGTPFQLAVLEAIRRIPYGETRTYQQIAASIGNPGAARAVGAACGRNPILIAIPCHRVVGCHNRLTGYAAGIARKQALLKLEQQNR